MISEVFNEDCMIGMARYPDKYFDLAVVDPPYGIGVTKMNMGGRSTVKPDASKTWDDFVPKDGYFDELDRVSKNIIVWGGNYFKLPPSQYFIIWDKGETMYGRDFAECEFAWVKSGGTRIIKISPVQPERIHPTQKPVKLYDWIYQKYLPGGGKVLDTHLGSGSNRIAAHKAGNIDFTAFEIDADYFKAQEDRFNEFKKQLTLF